MNFELSEQQQMLKSLVEKFTSDRYEIHSRKAYQALNLGFSLDNWRILADIGLLSLPFPSEDGGLDGSSVEIATVMEAFGKSLVTEPFLADILLSGVLLARSTTSDLRDHWLARIIAGEVRVALAHVEHSARFNIHHVETRAVKLGDVFELSGTKTLVLSAVGVDAYIVSARLPEAAPDSDDISLFLVNSKAAGIEQDNHRLVDGSLASDIRFDAVNTTMKLDCGFDDFLRVINTVRLAACAEMLGVMSMLFDATLDYVKTRKQFSVPIGSFQAIQHRMADLYAELEQSRSQLYRAMLLSDSDPHYEETIAGAKSYISERAVRLSRACIQLHGGMGISDELIIGHGHKRILLLATLFGNPDHELSRYEAITQNNYKAADTGSSMQLEQN